MKKLIPIICMLLVAVSLLGTATYAWFSMNLTVEATGMKVKAVSTGGIAIASYTMSDSNPPTPLAPQKEDFKAVAVAMANASGELFPTSTADCETWYTAFASATDNYYVDSNGYKAVTPTDLDDYVLTSRFQVKSLNSETTAEGINLYLTKISLEGLTSSRTLNYALRIAIAYGPDLVNGDPTSLHFIAPVRTGDAYSQRCVEDPSSIVNYPGGIEFGTEFTMNATDGVGDKVIKLGKATKEAQDLFVFVYFEGEDDACYSLNAIDVDTISIGFTFSTDTVPTTQPISGTDLPGTPTDLT